MINDFRFALTSKPVIIILFTSAAIRILVHFILLPQSPSVFGPDEGTYALLAIYVAQGLPVEEFPLYGPGLYNSAKSLAVPSALLVRFGFEGLNAVRIIASVYGLASSVFMVLSFLAYLRLRNPNIQIFNYAFDKKYISLLAVFTFLPSNFIWSTIGLRESASQFWLIATFYFTLKLLNSNGRDTWKFTVFILLALTLAFGARPQTALVFSFIAMFFAIIISVKRQTFSLAIAILIGFFAGQIFTTTPTAPTAPTAPKTIDPLKTIQNQIFILRTLENRRNVNAIDAQSALPKSTCQNSSTSLVIIISCNISELPYRIFAFLFRPLLFFDRGSTTQNFAALENLGWIMLVPLSTWVALRKKQGAINRLTGLALISYVFVFASSAALYEGNLGTAFRHKSTILWPLIFILMITPSLMPKFRKETTTVS